VVLRDGTGYDRHWSPLEDAATLEAERTALTRHGSFTLNSPASRSVRNISTLYTLLSFRDFSIAAAMD
jgi:hypothetical protein